MINELRQEYKKMTPIDYDEAFARSREYFNGADMEAGVFLDKYALKDSQGNIYEATPDDMHERIAKELHRIEQKYDDPYSYEEILDSIKNFKYLIPQGSPMAGIGNPFQFMSLSNCFVVHNPYDSYAGIMRTDEQLAFLMKRRAGVGTDISHLRPNQAPVRSAARTSTGAVSFMERYSNTTREVAQSGRRGALMLTISSLHPDVEEFIKIKSDKTKVTGANISVKIHDSFMEAVDRGDTTYTLQFPINVPVEEAEYTKEINPQEVWKELIKNAHADAEPGLLFWDNIINESIPDCYADLGFETVSTNPCITGDTIIATADGRNGVSIKQLADEGKDVLVWSTDVKTGKVEPKMGRHPRKTGEQKEVWKLTLDDGSTLTATPDHKILLRSGEYKELKDLSEGESIFPWNSLNSNGYRQISNTGAKLSNSQWRRNRRQYRLIHEYYNGVVDAKVYAIHHKDYDSENDAIENLEVMTHEAHRRLHAERMMGDKNPYHRMTDEWKFNFASKPGESNPSYCGIDNKTLFDHAVVMTKKKGRRFGVKEWQRYSKNEGLPQSFSSFRVNEHGSMSNFLTEAAAEAGVADNHKVVSVEFMGYEDVYNITVDDNHNYHVITSFEDDKFIDSSGICVKNCGEITLCHADSCRLLAINLWSFVENPFTDEARFNWILFKEQVHLAQRLMDDIVDLELEAVDKIIAKIKTDPEPEYIKRSELELWEEIKDKATRGRRTGTGITAVGDMLAGLGIRYGSDESIDFVEKVMQYKKRAEYAESVHMAKTRGAFPMWDPEREKDNPFLLRLKEEDPVLWEGMMYHGRRNLALSTIAPTGTTSMMAQTTSGIENLFLPVYFRSKKVNPNDANVRVDYTDDVGDSWQEYPVFHSKFKVFLQVNGLSEEEILALSKEEADEWVKKSPYYKATVNDVDWTNKVKMQGRVQKHVDHSISVTTNLPKGTPVEKVEEVYMTSWKAGCKGVTIYVDGSRTGVLNTESKKDTQSGIVHTTAPKRPETLPCDVYHTTAKGERWTVFVGILEGQPYEVFAVPGEHGKHKTVGKLTKVKSGRYDFENGEVVEDITGHNNDEEAALARMISTALRHGAKIDFVSEQLDKSQGSIISFAKAIARQLKKYVSEEGAERQIAASPLECPDDGAECNIVFQEGCVRCETHGVSKCT